MQSPIAYASSSEDEMQETAKVIHRENRSTTRSPQKQSENRTPKAPNHADLRLSYGMGPSIQHENSPTLETKAFKRRRESERSLPTHNNNSLWSIQKRPRNGTGMMEARVRELEGEQLVLRQRVRRLEMQVTELMRFITENMAVEAEVNEGGEEQGQDYEIYQEDEEEQETDIEGKVERSHRTRGSPLKQVDVGRYYKDARKE